MVTVKRPYENNRFIRAWIWIWYSQTTRVCILFGIPVIPVVLLCGLAFGVGEYLRVVAGATYLGLFVWAALDNDFSNLRRIGLDEYRNKF